MVLKQEKGCEGRSCLGSCWDTEHSTEPALESHGLAGAGASDPARGWGWAPRLHLGMAGQAGALKSLSWASAGPHGSPRLTLPVPLEIIWTFL